VSGGPGPVRVDAGRLQGFAASAWRALGVPAPWDDVAARVLLAASMEGHAAHGVERLPFYARRIRAGAVDAAALGRFIPRAPGLALLDGQNGLGQVLGVRAMRRAVDMARETGVAWVGVRHSNHFGPAGYYARLAAEAGAVGVAISNSPPAMPPWGGRRPYFGTNPIAVALPARPEPVVIDLATTVVARGRILEARAAGRDIPPDWALDGEGRPTTDPAAALAGALQPMAGHKGYALALAVETLAAVLPGALFGSGVPDHFSDFDRPSNLGHAFLALDVGLADDTGAFADRMARMEAELRAAPPAAGFDRVRLPGDGSRERREEALRQGLRIAPAAARELESLARDLGLAVPW
jgi:LDH2 family malate/lactate/ureidoglycolate dehydrogenase